MDSEEHVCPICGQPVETVVKRHKTLGAWVPVWGPGPCRNPDCAAHAGTGPRPAGQERSAGAQARPGGSGPGDPSAAGAENSAV
ncbi:hypothetical protein C3492_16520 [Streptomyces sp. Ru62]|uniref:hypothetical protein n=1 Tax=Streptomyces sp. Ru62 TaxID=2080745 RepID=UPI000CDD717D|nr:hypothetical protein [Streptomyces sp. Ru62]POX62345.1 hypothetical protein C3492_16520 [Streptomyces sp. Ru62]